MAIENLYPTIKPSLNLDFANTKTLDPRINFSRASAATYYDGKTVVKAEENLLLYSQDFGNAYWSKTGSTITVDQAVALDGTNTADKLTESTAYDNHFCRREINTTANETYAISIYAKNIDGVFLNLSAYSNASSSLYAAATFNLSTGVVANTGAVGAGFSVVSSSITLAGDAWYRCVLVFKNGSASPANQLAISLSETGVIGNYGLSVYTGDGVSGIYIWGAQLEQRSQVTAYTPTTTQAITKYQPVLRTVVAGAPRFDHDPLTGESLGLLIEEQRTNLFLNSSNLSGANFVYINKNENALVAPDGTQTGTLLFGAGQETAGGANTNINASATAATMTASVYVKVFPNDTAFYLAFLMRNDTTGTNFSTGLWNTATNTISGGWTIKSIGNDWYRVSYTNTTAQIISTGNNIRLYFGATGGPKLNKDLKWGVWGAQLEAGSFPTSYIKTEASQTTRVADNVTMTGENFSSWYRADEGTFFSESRCGGIGSGGAAATVMVATNSQNLMAFGQYITDGLRVVTSTTNNAVVVNLSDSGITYPSSYYKSVGTYKNDDFAGRISNGSILTDTSGGVPVVTSMSIGSTASTGSSSQHQNGHVRKIAYYPKRLSNNNLAALTT